MISGIPAFKPDLIVEVTSVCDRACVGCYAPNVISKGPADELFATSPHLFMNPTVLLKEVSKFKHRLGSVAVRGGEPSRHPKLAEILSILETVSESVIIETHGRWLLPPAIKDFKPLLDAVAISGATVKISFDRMHGLHREELRAITQTLSWHYIPVLVAITESTEEEFKRSRTLCDWMPDSAIIQQQKAIAAESLVTPIIGVLTVNGTLRGHVTHKDSFVKGEILQGILDRRAIP